MTAGCIKRWAVGHAQHDRDRHCAAAAPPHTCNRTPIGFIAPAGLWHRRTCANTASQLPLFVSAGLAVGCHMLVGHCWANAGRRRGNLHGTSDCIRGFAAAAGASFAHTSRLLAATAHSRPFLPPSCAPQHESICSLGWAATRSRAACARASDVCARLPLVHHKTAPRMGGAAASTFARLLSACPAGCPGHRLPGNEGCDATHCNFLRGAAMSRVARQALVAATVLLGVAGELGA